MTAPLGAPLEAADKAGATATAIVLARAGSKGLPGKNGLPVAGRPMLAWTLGHALASEHITEVVLSTDGPVLAALGASMPGVRVLERPAELAHDTATVDDAARQALATLEEDGTPRERVAILYGNIPLRPADLTDRALRVLIESGCDSVQSVCRVGKTHPYWMKRVTGDAEGGALEPYVENHVYRRQDLPPVYLLDGGVIALTRASLLTTAPGEPHAFLGQDRRAVITDPGEVVDVDTAADLAVAEAMLLSRRERSAL